MQTILKSRTMMSIGFLALIGIAAMIVVGGLLGWLFSSKRND